MLLNENEFSYPAMLKLQGKRCLIIGGGQVAARKLVTLAEAGAQVTVIAPQFAPLLLQEAARLNCRLVQDCYKPEQLQNAFLVVAATDSKEVNAQITQAAPCLCNNITQPELSNFTVPSSFNVGKITIALATGGMPAYTRLLKAYLKGLLPPEFSHFNDFLQEQRHIVKNIPSSPQDRTAFWRSVLTEELIKLLAAGKAAEAKEKVTDAVNSFRAQSQNGSR